MRNIPSGAAKKKTSEMIKEELFSSILEIEDEDELELDEEVKAKKDPKEAVTIIKRNEKILRNQKRRIINIVEKQGQLLKWFKEAERFIDTVGLNRSHFCFKIGLYKFLSKYTLLKTYDRHYHRTTSKQTLRLSKKFAWITLNYLVKKNSGFI